jgi:hypothetical protein
MKLSQYFSNRLGSLFAHNTAARSKSPISDRAEPIEALEARIVPGALIATVSGHTLTIKGSNIGADTLTIADTGTLHSYLLTATSGSTINGQSSFTTAAVVNNIVINLGNGADSLTFAASPSVDVFGNLTITGGGGVKTITATNLIVLGNLSISEGRQNTGTSTTTLYNLNAFHAVSIATVMGNNDVYIERTHSGFNYIGGPLTVSTGTGAATTDITDTNVTGNVTINNGHGALAGGSSVDIYNEYNTTQPSTFGGNVTVNSIDGNVDNRIWDSEVLGNVTFNQGKGAGVVYADGYLYDAPVFVRGNFTVNGSGLATLYIGQYDYKTGLTTGRNFTLNESSSGDTLDINNLHVGGATTVTLGSGPTANDNETIDNSTFNGLFKLTTNNPIFNTLKIDTQTGSSAPTIFESNVLITQNGGTNSTTFGGTTDSEQLIEFFGTFLYKAGGGSSSALNLYSPFGLTVKYIE